jgi:hypothetical protein
MRSFRNTLSQARLSISRSDPESGVQRVRLRDPKRLWFNHARYDDSGFVVERQMFFAGQRVHRTTNEYNDRTDLEASVEESDLGPDRVQVPV